MKLKKILFLGILIIIFTNTIFATNNLQDEYLIKCTIPSKYFIQSFTCLNTDCSIQLQNKNNNILPIELNEKKIGYVTKTYIKIKNLTPDFNFINNICEEPIEKNTLMTIQNKYYNYFNDITKTYTGEQTIIEPLTEEIKKQLEEKQKKYNENLNNCYQLNIKKSNNWILEEKELKEYCSLTNQIKNSTEISEMTTISQYKFFIYLVKTPSWYTLFFIIITIILFVIIDMFIEYKQHLHKNKQLKRFFKTNKLNIKISLIIIIPVIYIWGAFINTLFVNKSSLTFIIQQLLLIIGIIITYYIACLIEYIYSHIQKKH